MRERPWRDKEAKAIIAVSDMAAVELALRYRGKGGLMALLLWNLPREDFLDLARELGSPLDGDTLWRMLGGNARALGELALNYRWDLERWVRESALPPVKTVAKQEADERAEAWEALRRWERPDNLWLLPLSLRPFLRHNVLLRIDFAAPLAPLPQEPWIGRDFAFQLPAYWWALKAMAERGTVEVEARDVLRAAEL